MDNQLAYIDQGSFLALRALGRAPHQQYIWVYDHDMDFEGLKRFHENLGYTLFGRRIERSPLPFGRHRWVADPHQADLDISAPRPRAGLRAWLLEQAVIPVDPERGPSWRMAAVPFTEGGGAVMVMVSHSVADGGAIFTSIADAALGRRNDYGYDKPGSRPRGKAIREDLAATVKDLPEVGRSIKAAVRVARQEKTDLKRSAQRSAGKPVNGTASAIHMPSITVLVPLAEWDACAERLGGTSNAMMAALAARLGSHRGRADRNGMVTINMPVSDRKEGDNRANALTGVSVEVDSGEAITSLKKIRADIKSTLVNINEQQHELAAALPLTPFTPKRLLRKLEGMALGAGYPVGCTNMGDVNPILLRPDGTVAQMFFARSPIDWPVTAEILDKLGGTLVVASARLGEKFVLVVSGWQVGAVNTEEQLTEDVMRALSDFGLTGTLFV